MVVGFTANCVISAYHHYNVVSSNPADDKVCQWRVTSWRFSLVSRFSPLIKMTVTI